MNRYYFILFSILLVVTSCDYSRKSHNKTMRILTCGIRHESNTFCTVKTGIEDFKILRGNDILYEKHLWSDYLKKQNVEIIPTLHAYAWPGGVVTKQAYEELKKEILEKIKTAGNIDGIYMDMHGALHVEGYQDAQVDFIRSIRNIVGRKVVISASFDTHGNMSNDFVEDLNFLTGFRTVPHRDGEETKLRAVKKLIQIISEKIEPKIVSVTIPILVPGEKSITEVEPLHSIYARLDTLDNLEGIMDASIFAGYAWADLPRSAMRVFVIAKDSSYINLAEKEALQLSQRIWNVRNELEMDVESGSIDDMIKRASKEKSTVFISDSGDNTTAGSPGDNPQVIEALIKNQVTNSLYAGLVDKEAYDKCRKAGVGNILNIKMGGRKDTIFGKPLRLDVEVVAMSSDSLLDTPRGVILVKSKGVHIALLNSRRSFTTIRDFTDIGLNPLDFKIVVVKLGYLYPELRDIAPLHLMALTTGFCNLDMRSLPFKQVIRPSYPLDLTMEWKPLVN